MGQNNSTRALPYNALVNATRQSLPWLTENTFGFHDSRLVFNVTCAAYVNAALDGATESGKAGSQLASILMAFIPALITLANLWAPRSAEAFSTSFLMGTLSAIYRLSLPIKSVSGVPKPQTLTVEKLDRKWFEKIYEFGDWPDKVAWLRFPWQIARVPRVVDMPLSEFRDWFDRRKHVRSHIQAERLRPVAEKFCFIKEQTATYSLRTHSWYFLQLASCTVYYLAMFGGLYVAIVLLAGLTIWLCQSAGVLWLLALATLSVLVQIAMWELSDHERVKCWKLNSLYHLGHLLDDSRPNAETIAKHIPPLARDTTPWETLRRAVSRTWHSFIYHIVHPWKAVTSRSARNFPIVVLVYLAPSGQNPFIRILTGFIQGVFLVCLTFFFGSFWGGNVKNAFILLFVILFAIAFGRLLGVFYIRWSSKAYGLHVIECAEKIQVRGILRLLPAMALDILVQINGAMYVHGIRVDHEPKFQQYLIDLDRGRHDYIDSLTTEAFESMMASSNEKVAGDRSSMVKDAVRTSTMLDEREREPALSQEILASGSIPAQETMVPVAAPLQQTPKVDATTSQAGQIG